MTDLTIENVRKDLRANSRFLAGLCIAEAALRPFVNDWAHLEAQEEEKFRSCLELVLNLQRESRNYEGYLNEQLQTVSPMRPDGDGDAVAVERLQTEKSAETDKQDTER